MIRSCLVARAGRAVLASVLVIAVASPASAQNFNNASVLRLPYRNLQGNACLNEGCTRVLQFGAAENTDLNTGTRYGELSVLVDGEAGLEWRLFCAGPKFVGLIQMQRKQFSSSVSAVIDPTTPGCTSSNLTSPLVVNVVGQLASGGSATSTVGTTTITSPTGTQKLALSADDWDTLLSGTFGGLVATMNGSARESRFNVITRK